MLKYDNVFLAWFLIPYSQFNKMLADTPLFKIGPLNVGPACRIPSGWGDGVIGAVLAARHLPTRISCPT